MMMTTKTCRLGRPRRRLAAAANLSSRGSGTRVRLSQSTRFALILSSGAATLIADSAGVASASIDCMADRRPSDRRHTGQVCGYGKPIYEILPPSGEPEPAIEDRKFVCCSQCAALGLD